MPEQPREGEKTAEVEFAVQELRSGASQYSALPSSGMNAKDPGSRWGDFGRIHRDGADASIPGPTEADEVAGAKGQRQGARRLDGEGGRSRGWAGRGQTETAL